MKKLTIPAVIAASICVGGCVSMLAGAPPAIDMAYTTENPRGAGVVQVFEIGANTVIQVRNIDTVRPSIEDEHGNQLKYQIYGQNAVLEGRHNVIRVVTLNGSSTVKRNTVATTRSAGTSNGVAQPGSSSVAPIASAAPTDATGASLAAASTAEASSAEGDARSATESRYANESPAALQAEIERMKKELEEIKGLLNQASTGGAPKVPQRPAKPAPEAFQSSTVIVQFADNSDRFEPSIADRQTIRDLARSASKLKVAGYTDSFTPSHHAKALATLRAYAAREYLVAEGVNPAKITVKAVPSGSFIADNRTKDGKAANRRVEITAS